MVTRIIDEDNELKKIAGQVSTYNWKNFHWLNKKLGLKCAMTWLQKPFWKKKSQQKSQNHYSNLTLKIMKMCEHIFKKRQRPNTIQIH